MTSSLRPIHFTSIAPPGLVDDIVATYRLAAQELGYPTTFADQTVVPGILNIIFFCWSLKWTTVASLHPQCIVVNFEHLHENSRYLLPSYQEILERSYVWEYSETNFHRQKALGIQAADYVPLGYQPGADAELSVIDVLPDDQRDIDVFFVGQVNERRLKILTQLRAHGLNVLSGAFPSNERDAYLRRTKVALNLHQFDDSRIVESPRLTILFRNRKAVVCEVYRDSELAPDWREAVVGAPYDGLVAATLALLNDPSKRAELEPLGHDRLTRTPQRAFVAAALTRFDQWLSQREGTRPIPQNEAHGRVTVVLTDGTAHDSEWNQTIESLAQQDRTRTDVMVIAASTSLNTSLASLDGVRRLDFPLPIDRASARNLGLAEADGDYVVFAQAGEVWAPERLQRQSAFLDAHPEIDIVGSWLGTDSPEATWHKTPELDDEIKAEFLAHGDGLALCTCMLRRRFLQQHSLRFDAQFDSHHEAHFLYRCASVASRFAVIPAVLCERRTVGCSSLAPAGNNDSLITHARLEMLAAYFPALTGREIRQLGELYASQWPPDLRFATGLLDVLAKASAFPSQQLNLTPATVRRTLRHEAARVIRIFTQGGFIDLTWLDAQFEKRSTATLLAPVRSELEATS